MIIISSSITAPVTLAFINRLENINKTKILLIDIGGDIFNNQNVFYQNLNRYTAKVKNVQSDIANNIFVLTILTGKLKQFLNISLGITNNNNINNNSVSEEINYDKVTTTEFIPSKSNGRITRNLNPTTNYNQSDISSIVNLGLSNQEIATTRINEFINLECENSSTVCKTVTTNTSSCENYFKLNSSLKINSIKILCAHLVNDQKTIDILLNNTKTKRNIKSNQSSDVCPVFGEFFTLFDFIVSTIVSNVSIKLNRTIHASYEFMVLNFRTNKDLLNQTVTPSSLVWNPFLMLKQNQINDDDDSVLFRLQHIPVLPVNDDWFKKSMKLFWKCGLQCWIITILAILVLCILIVGGVAAANAVR